METNAIDLIKRRYDFCKKMEDISAQNGLEDERKRWASRAEGVKDALDILE